VRVRATAIGWRAHAALDVTGGRARVIAALTDSCYADAAGELIWLGPGDRALHARAVIAGEPATADVDALIDVVSDGAAAWHPAALPACGSLSVAGLLAVIPSLGAPRGLGRLLVPGDGARGADQLLERARPHAARLAAACSADDPDAAIAPAVALLGLGEGLTPNGDDYVGGALFGVRAAGRTASAWRDASAHIVREARTRTHPISARLLGDLAAGEGWASLHDLTDAIGAGNAAGTAIAARRVVALGASSGWDVLAGFVAGLLGRLPE
jgi:hypothetical protein